MHVCFSYIYVCVYVNRLVLCQCGMQPLPPCFDAHTVDHIDAHDCNSNKQHSLQQHSIHQGIKNTAAVENKHVYKGCLLLPCIEEESANNSDSISSSSVSSNSSSNKRDIAAAEAAREVCTFVVLLPTTLLACTSMLAAVCMLIHGRRYQVETL
jgi:hypothetical protein